MKAIPVPALKLDSVSVSLEGKQVLTDVSFEVEVGQWFGLVGPNGAGKSTLLKAIAQIVPSQGTIGVQGIANLGRQELARQVCYVGQTPVFPLGMTVFEYVLLGRAPHLGLFATESKADREIVEESLELLELNHFAARPVAELSGGEAQSACLARSLAQRATVLLLDEPTSALDFAHQISALELVETVLRERNLTVISVMHDLTLAGEFADHLALLAGGEVVASGLADQVLTADLLETHFGGKVEIVTKLDGSRLVLPLRN